MRKALVAILTALVLGVAMGQAGPHVGLFLSIGNNEYNRSVEQGVRDYVEARGGRVTDFDANFDPAEQMNQLQDAITSGNYDAFIVYSVDGVSMTSGADLALEAGIPFIAVDVPVHPNRETLVPYASVTAQIARTGVGDGEQLGEAIVMACEGLEPCEVAFLIGFQGLSIDQDRLNALRGILSPHDHIELVTVQAAEYLRDVGYTVTTDILQANRGIDVIASVGDQMSLGARLAAEDAGLENQIKIIGNGASKEGYEAVANGQLFATVVNIPYTNGKIAAQMALQALAGDLVVRSVDMYDQSPPIPASGPVITADNLSEFEPEW